MRYSKLFGRSLRQAPKEAEAISHKLLVKGGFIDQVAAGIYSFLPLGFRVQEKIGQIIREEMDAIGGQEVFLPTLQPKSLWLETDRWDHMEPPLFKLKDRHGRELALGSTHEEVLTDLVRTRITSYKDLPLGLYQIQNKFRNEMRSTGGLLRVREFMMKDLYSFHADKKDLDSYFKKVRDAYHKIYKRCGLDVLTCQASGGTIGGDITFEFHVEAEVGEDTIFSCSKCSWAANKELVGATKKCPECGSEIKKISSIEVGHIFSLGTKYSESMGAYFIDKEGKKKPILMGCYGTGLGRLMAAIVEVHHDEKGIIWPESVAPFDVHLIDIPNEKKAKTEAGKVYETLKKKGIEVLWDDRNDVSAGVKFADADLIGIPLRLVSSEELTKNGKIEYKRRNKRKVEKLTLGQVVKRLTHD